MIDRVFKLPAEQQAIRDKCFHPTGTFVEFPKEEIEQSIPDRFEQIVAAHSGRLAVKTKGAELTYDELNRKANRVAHALLARHGSVEEPVLLLLDNGAPMIVSIIGALKAAKIYVPLDPSFPILRHREILEDTAAGLIVTDSKNLSLAEELAAGKLALVNIDEIDRSVSDDNLRPRAAPDTPAYILYTSGSTGKPKGVLQNHRNVLHLIMRHTNRGRVRLEDRIALLRSFGVHGGTYDTFAALLNGAAILPFDIKRRGMRELAKWLAREEISLCRIGPTPFRHLAQALGEADRFPRLRMLSFSGEPLHGNDIELCRRYFSPDCIVVNSFGATEVSSCCEYIIDPKTRIEDGVVACGTAARDMKIYLLDDDGKEARPGEIGEIAVKSRYLALGYWKRPELTHAKFAPDPDGGEERVYLTGDLGRMLPDGRLLHVGRKDFQVKIRGYRVEAGEVEAALLALGNIKEAVAVARQDRERTSRLIAYLVPRKAPPPTVIALRRALAKKIPEHMIPSTFVFVDRLPLTPNGKVDRRALPEPSAARPKLQLPPAAPRNPTEKTTVDIWEAVLGVDQVGIHDNFLDLGGNSLLAAQIVSRVFDEFHIELPLRLILETPTVAALAQHIDTALRTVRGRGGPALKPAPRNARLPLSFAQQRLWFLNQLEPESPAYNESRAYRLSGVLDMTAVQKALDQIVARHEVLRTNFVSVDGIPKQVIAETRPVELPLIDLSAWPESGREAEARRLLAENVRRTFDLSRDLMLRVMLVRLDEQEHILLVVTHHIASDGWSSGIFWQELADLYRSVVSSEPWELSELPIQYADFAIWQRNRLRGEFLEAQLSYWKKQLDGVEPLRLPTDRQPSATSTSPGAKQSLTLAKTLSDGLKALSRQQGATLFMTLLAAFQTLLNRYTGQTDIVVGTPIAGRPRLEVEKLIGFFVNTLVLRTDCSNDPTFCELLERVRQKAADAYAHQEVPFEKLVEELQPERNLGSLPLFQVMFRLQNVPRSSIAFPGLTLSAVEAANGTAKLDLSLSMQEQPDGLKATLEYNTDLFDDATITRMLGQLQVLIEGIVAGPDRPISALPILTEPERHQLLIEWNDTKIEYPKDKCIHELFETQAEKTPDAIAAVCEDQQLSYRELNNRANQLAHYLRRLGVGPEVLVGICMERSLELVVGILGILKAGGAYVPLDPSYPAERLEFMVADAQVSVLLTQEGLFADGGSRIDDSERRFVKLDPRIQRVCLDRDWALISMESDANPESITTADNLAYVIYTSGSTGKPKGVAIEHRNTVAFLFWAHSVFTKNELCGVLVATSICFDLSVFEIFAPLTCGGTIILAENALALATIPNRATVSLLNTVPSAMNELLRLDAIPPSVRVINLAGEPLRTDLARRIYESTSVRKVHDLYGPSESTTYSTWTCRSADGRQTIGRPIANTQIYILDAHRNPVPIGVVGGIYIGGAGVARGYLNRPELTAERFIHHSLDGEVVQRLYKTGDLARYLPDGNIEFLGRLDHQVKIRGFRIELGEIESVLSQYPGVRESVVVAREDAPGDKRLVAYLVAASQNSSVSDLRGFLKAKLPEYMIPSAFMFLDALPLTPNGKIDHKSLPAPDRHRDGLEQAYVAPRSPTEEILAGIWEEVLNLHQVGVHDNFFELGGHSLLATQVISRLRVTLRMEIPLRFLFENPTVAGLAERIEEIQRKDHGLQTPPLLPVSRDKDLPLSFAQQRLWFLDQYEPGSSAYNIPAALRLKGALNVSALEQSLQEMVNRHEALRTTFSMVEREAVQVIAPSLKLALPLVDLSETPEAEREEQAQRLAQEEARRPFDLTRGPLFRTRLLQLGKEDHVLLMTLHHIVSDGWSMGVMHHELSVLYQAFTNSQPSPLPDLPIQYADYAVWQREWLKGEELERQLSYWKKQLENIQTLQLPTDRPRPAVQSYRGASQSIVLPRELTEALKTLSRQQGVTLFMTLLAGFQTLLHRYTGQDDIAVGAPIAGRNLSRIEGLIGFFVNTLVLRADLSGNPDFRELLAREREVCLGAYAHQELPFERLVEELHPGRDLSRPPLFQVFFNMNSGDRRTLNLPGLHGEWIDVPEAAAKFDMTVYARERGGELGLSLVYNLDLFDAATISRLLGHYHTLLQAIVADPQRAISSLPLLTEAERHQLAARRNRVTPDNPFIEFKKAEAEQPLHARFEQMAERYADRRAVKTVNDDWTYSELNRRANCIARAILRACGRGAERAALFFDHGAPMIAALLGALKAGKTYVPLDPAYPAERLGHLLKDSQAEVIITDNRNVSAAAQLVSGPLPVINIDDADSQSTDNPGLPISPDALAYILYTSGSTGQPKGVMQSHRNVLHHIRNYTNSLRLTPDDKLTLLSSYGFDAAVMDIFGALLNGAALLPADIKEESCERLLGRMAEEGVTIYHSTPTVYRYLFGSLTGKENLSAIRLVVLGGEEVHKEDVDLFQRRFSSKAIFVNGLGPTESTLALQYFIDCTTELAGNIVPVGYPVEETEIFLLDEAGREAEIYGEIGIRSAHVALGYWGKPEMTGAAFLPDPMDRSKRLYRTGDLGRLLPDGSIAFAGRKDFQVKIRGFRIELGEIETALYEHAAVREAAVVAREDTPDPSTALGTDSSGSLPSIDSGSELVKGRAGKRLVAYVVASQESAPMMSELRAFLQHKLPEYMIPSAFVFLESLPLSPNGKIDQKSLPAPDLNRDGLEQAYVAPRSPTEEILAGIWAEVLKLDQVGIHDNFFDLGGHSLLATQVISRMRKVFQRELPLRHLFEFPTIAELAAVISASAEQPVANSKNIDLLLTEIEAMSEGEAQKQFAEKSAPSRSAV